MSLQTSPIVLADDPAVDDDLWQIPSAFAANWQQSVRIDNQYTTDVKYAQSLLSSREGLRGKPRRVITAALLGLTGRELLKLRSFMFRQAQARSFCPIFCDQTFMTVVGNVDDFTITCDTTLRRFFVGGRVLVCKPLAGTGEFAAYEIHKINGITDTTLTFTVALVNAFPAGSRVYPLIEGKTVLSPDLDLETDTAATTTLAVQEDVGVTQLPSLVTANSNPAGFPTHSGLPVLTLRPDWKQKPQIGVERTETLATSGITDLSQMKGTRAVVTGTLAFDFISRADAWSLKRFWESRRGRLFPFILPMPMAELSLLEINVGGNDAVVEAIGFIHDWSFYQFICFELTDGSLAIAKIGAWERQIDGTDYVQFDGTLDAGITLGQVRRATFAIAACFSDDNFSEEWTTEETMSTTLAFREFPFDDDVDLGIAPPTTGIDRPAAGPGPGTPGNPPPITKTYCRLRDCHGNLLDAYVPANPPPTDRIYSDGMLYSVDCSDPVVGTPPGPVIGGWQEVPFGFDDPSNPEWVPPCEGRPCPDLSTCPGSVTVTVVDSTGPYGGGYTIPRDLFAGMYNLVIDSDDPSSLASIDVQCSDNGDGTVAWAIGLRSRGGGASFWYKSTGSGGCPPGGSYSNDYGVSPPHVPDSVSLS